MLDFYRFILAVLVVQAHLLADGLPGLAWQAVFSFYVLSGFLMTLVLNEVYGFGVHGFVRFFTNRILRLYPAYYALLLVTILFIVYVSPANQLNGALSLPQTTSGLARQPLHDRARRHRPKPDGDAAAVAERVVAGNRAVLLRAARRLFRQIQGAAGRAARRRPGRNGGALRPSAADARAAVRIPRPLHGAAGWIDPLCRWWPGVLQPTFPLVRAQPGAHRYRLPAVSRQRCAGGRLRVPRFCQRALRRRRAQSLSRADALSLRSGARQADVAGDARRHRLSVVHLALVHRHGDHPAMERAGAARPCALSGFAGRIRRLFPRPLPRRRPQCRKAAREAQAGINTSRNRATDDVGSGAVLSKLRT